jgi:hypothetical protein
MTLLEELERILNFDNSAPEIAELINDLKKTELDRYQEELIYDLVARAYELGKSESGYN